MNILSAPVRRRPVFRHIRRLPAGPRRRGRPPWPMLIYATFTRFLRFFQSPEEIWERPATARPGLCGCPVTEIPPSPDGEGGAIGPAVGRVFRSGPGRSRPPYENPVQPARENTEHPVQQACEKRISARGRKNRLEGQYRRSQARFRSISSSRCFTQSTDPQRIRRGIEHIVLQPLYIRFRHMHPGIGGRIVQVHLPVLIGDGAVGEHHIADIPDPFPSQGARGGSRRAPQSPWRDPSEPWQRHR